MSRFVKLDDTLIESDAWKWLKPGPRALYVALKYRFNGSNNGRIMLSHREAAAELNVHRNTIGGFFEALEEVGLIEKTSDEKIGPAGVGKCPAWKLAELPENKASAEPKSPRKAKGAKPPKFKAAARYEDPADDVLDDEVGF